MKKKGVMKDLENFYKAHPLSINIWMMISYKGVDRIKWTSSGTWINGEYYRENILKKYVLNDKNDSDFGGMFFSSMTKLGLTWRQQLKIFWKNIISTLLSGLLKEQI